MRVDFLSLFPEYFEQPLNLSILGRAVRSGLLQVHTHQLRDYAQALSQRVDDRTLGGGPGMLLCLPPLSKAIQALKGPSSHVVYLSPAGQRFDRHHAKRLSYCPHLIFICGHYEGIDQRVIDEYVDEELSIGDFVLTNGCLAALTVLDALVRFIPGALGDERSVMADSFESPWLDHPHYTFPISYEGLSVPEVLRTGHHGHIEHWRLAQAQKLTWERRGDLLEGWLDPSQGSPGAILATRWFSFYRRLLERELRLPWIDKNATMGALVYEGGQLLFWEEASDDSSAALDDDLRLPTVYFRCLIKRPSPYWRNRLTRLAQSTGYRGLTFQEQGCLLQDPLGWRLHLVWLEKEGQPSDSSKVVTIK